MKNTVLCKNVVNGRSQFPAGQIAKQVGLRCPKKWEFASPSAQPERGENARLKNSSRLAVIVLEQSAQALAA